MEEVESYPEKKESSRDWGRLFTLVLLLVTFANVLILDWVVGSSSESVGFANRLDAVEEKVKRLSQQFASFSPQEATLSAYPTLAVPTLMPTPTPQVVEKETVFEKVVTQIQTSQVKEYYVPLGRASVRTEKFNWTDTGAEAIVDLSNYDGVKEVSFEATLSVESGEVEARLYNVTDSYAVYGSTLVGAGPHPALHRSGNLVFHSGAKTYRVQMRTSLNYTAEMDNARIRILVE
jgi:hypothetical protein